MRSSYKKIGRYVQPANKRNKDMAVTNLRGININKLFMPSVANTVGVDLSKYKVVSKHQFAFNPMHVGRDEMLPISMLEADEPVIVSPAYAVFEIKDHEELDPEYLMMWCRRPEFDRNAWFTTDSSVRGGFSWSDFCEMELPVPSIEKQRDIVQEYNIIVNRIQLNEQLNQKLEETAQAIYKHWFVDFEFPITKEYAASIGKPELEGKPYKSSGGEMVFCEELEQEIPNGCEYCVLSKLVDTQYGYTASASAKKVGPKFLRITDIAQNEINWDSVPYCKIKETDKEKYLLRAGDIVVARTGATVGYAKIIGEQSPSTVFASYLVRLSPNCDSYRAYIGLTVTSDRYKEYIQNVAGGSGQPQASATLMTEFKLFNPVGLPLEQFNILVSTYLRRAEHAIVENASLRSLKDLCLSGLAANYQKHQEAA